VVPVVRLSEAEETHTLLRYLTPDEFSAISSGELEVEEARRRVEARRREQVEGAT